MKRFSYLNTHFFERPTLKVAEDLLGCILCRQTPQGVVQHLIVEVEAYLNENATHTEKKDKVIPEEELFQSSLQQFISPPKTNHYLYLIYGMSHCLSVVTRVDPCPATILIRAIAPLPKNFEVTDPYHLKHRLHTVHAAQDIRYLSPSDKIARHLNLARAGDLFILNRIITPQKIIKTPRVNFTQTKEKCSYLWRFYFDPTGVFPSETTHDIFSV